MWGGAHPRGGWRSVRFYCCTGGSTLGGARGFCFLNALVARRKLMRASMPSLVPRISDVSIIEEVLSFSQSCKICKS